MADLAAGTILTAATFNMKVRKNIARASRSTNSSAGGVSPGVGVLRLDDKPILAGHTYRITWNAKIDVSTANDQITGVIRYTTDGTTPTTASSILPGSAADMPVVSITLGTSNSCITDYTPVADETLSVLLCVFRKSGAGNGVMEADGTSILTNMYIDDMGDDPGDTGTDI